MTNEYLDRPPAGWFVLDVMRTKARKWDWVALMIDSPPGELNYSRQEAWIRLPGKHRNKDAAWAALEDMLATRH